MEVVKRIKLLDCSLHDNKQSAERHLFNMLSSGVCLELFEKLSNKNTLKVKDIFIENEKLIEQTMQIIRELKQLEKIRL